MDDKINILIQSIKNTPAILSHYLLLIPENDLDRRRKPGFWTIREHLIHLVKTQPILLDRIKAFKNQEKPVITPYFPDAGVVVDRTDDASPNELMSAFASKRKEQFDLLNAMKESDFHKEASHDEYTRYNLEILANHILFHDYWHLYRIEELWLTKDEYLNNES